MAKYIFLIFLFFCFVCFSNEKIEINADQFTYDKENTRIYATGNVEIIDREFKLYAEKVFVNNTSKVLSARENIKVFNSDGSILKQKKLLLTTHLTMQSLRIISFISQLRMAKKRIISGLLLKK